jgi:cytochrome c-type biogenesis protein CcmF
VAGAGAIVAFALGLREPGPLATLALAAGVATVMIDEVVRGARARARSREEDPATATWRLATRNRRRYGGYVVHLGVLVMAVAVAVSSAMAIDRTVTIAPGESAEIGGYVVTHRGLTVAALPSDSRVIETRVEVGYAGTRSGTLHAALRDYPNSPTPIATPGVSTSLADDLYVTLLATDPDTATVTLHLFVIPLVAWIWIGGAVVGIGAAFAAWPERRAVRAPAVEPAKVPGPASVERA